MDDQVVNDENSCGIATVSGAAAAAAAALSGRATCLNTAQEILSPVHRIRREADNMVSTRTLLLGLFAGTSGVVG